MVHLLQNSIFHKKSKCSVFTNNGFHGPLPGYEIAPSRGTTGNRYYTDSRIMEVPERLIGVCGEFTISCESVIDVRTYVADLIYGFACQFPNGFHFIERLRVINAEK